MKKKTKKRKGSEDEIKTTFPHPPHTIIILFRLDINKLSGIWKAYISVSTIQAIDSLMKSVLQQLRCENKLYFFFLPSKNQKAIDK